MSAPLVKLSDVCEQIRGVSYSGDDAIAVPESGYLAVLRANNITDEGLSLDDLTYVPEARISAKQLVIAGDVVIAASSGSLSVVGKAAPAMKNLNMGFGAFCKVLRPNSKIDHAYFAHFFKTKSYRQKVSSLAAGANINNLRNEHLDDLPFPLPPREEQRRIAAILDQAETLRTQRRTALALLDSLTQSLFLDMFGDPVANPKGWSMSTIGDLAEVQGGLQVTSARKNLPSEVPYLRVANVYRGVLDLSEIKTIRATPAEIQRTTLVKNDLLVVEGHGNPNEIGRAALWNGDIEQCVHQNHLIRARFDFKKVEPVFASEYVNSPGGRQHLLRAGKSTSGLNTISVSNVRETPIALPHLPLQQTFATRIASIEVLKATHRRALAALDALFASLQQRAFAGQL